MGAVGNYEVATEVVGPIAGQGSAVIAGVVNAPVGKRILGVTVTLNQIHPYDRLWAQVKPSSDGTSATWELVLPTGGSGAYLTVHMMCAEMGC